MKAKKRSVTKIRCTSVSPAVQQVLLPLDPDLAAAREHIEYAVRLLKCSINPGHERLAWLLEDTLHYFAEGQSEEDLESNLPADFLEAR